MKFPQTTQELPELLSVKETERVLAQSRTVVMRLIYTGQIAAAKVGKVFVVGKESVREYSKREGVPLNWLSIGMADLKQKQK